MARILVIDDVAVVGDYMAGILRTLGHEVSAAASGREGLVLFEKEAFDLVLTDLHMPDQGGIATIAAIQSLRPRTPVLIMTGDLPPTGPRLQLEAFLGTAQMLKKPFSDEELEDAVRKALRSTNGVATRD